MDGLISPAHGLFNARFRNGTIFNLSTGSLKSEPQYIAVTDGLGSLFNRVRLSFYYDRLLSTRLRFDRD